MTSCHGHLVWHLYPTLVGGLKLCFTQRRKEREGAKAGQTFRTRSDFLKVDDAALEGAGGGLGAVGDAEFAEDVVDVAFDRGFTDV